MFISGHVHRDMHNPCSYTLRTEYAISLFFHSDVQATLGPVVHRISVHCLKQYATKQSDTVMSCHFTSIIYSVKLLSEVESTPKNVEQKIARMQVT